MYCVEAEALYVTHTEQKSHFLNVTEREREKKRKREGEREFNETLCNMVQFMPCKHETTI